MSLPSNDNDAWYYPSYGFESNDEDLPRPAFRGNWGVKTYNQAKWARKGKMTAWGPWMEDWEVRLRHFQSEDSFPNYVCRLKTAPESVSDSFYLRRRNRISL